jgi:hypothetical protein
LPERARVACIDGRLLPDQGHNVIVESERPRCPLHAGSGCISACHLHTSERSERQASGDTGSHRASAALCRIWLYQVKGAGSAGATARPAGGTSGAVLGRAQVDLDNGYPGC